MATLAKSLGIAKSLLIINKSDEEDDIARVSEMVGIPVEYALRVRYDRSVIEADRKDVCLLDGFPTCDAINDIRSIKRMIEG